MNIKNIVSDFSKGFAAVAAAVTLSGCASVASTAHPDFNGIWEITEYDEVIRPEENAVYTEEALAREKMFKENFDTVNESHAIFCDTTGMPWTMLGRARNYPREIFQTESRIVFFMEYMDQVRQIHLDKQVVPENFPGSRQGYSIAHWEGDELVITTDHFIETSEATIYHRSTEAKITERWRLGKHPTYGETLEVKMVLEDPVFYKEPVTMRTLWQRAPDGTVLGTYACPRTLWDNFVSERMDQVEH